MSYNLWHSWVNCKLIFDSIDVEIICNSSCIDSLCELDSNYLVKGCGTILGKPAAWNDSIEVPFFVFFLFIQMMCMEWQVLQWHWSQKNTSFKFF